MKVICMFVIMTAQGYKPVKLQGKVIKEQGDKIVVDFGKKINYHITEVLTINSNRCLYVKKNNTTDILSND